MKNVIYLIYSLVRTGLLFRLTGPYKNKQEMQQILRLIWIFRSLKRYTWADKLRDALVNSGTYWHFNEDFWAKGLTLTDFQKVKEWESTARTLLLGSTVPRMRFAVKKDFVHLEGQVSFRGKGFAAEEVSLIAP